jgi:glycosyltransferase involved in cell wall biosynthesis
VVRAEPLRVLLVADAVGGVWDHSLLLARGLIRLAGARVLLLAAGPAPDATRSAAAGAVPGLEWRALAGQLEWMDGGRDWLGVWRREVAALASGWGADVVHVNQLGLAGVAGEPLLSTMPRRPALVLGVHSDVVTWWRWVKGGGQQGAPLPEYLTWQRELAHQALRCADRVVCPSAFLARELATTYRLSALPVVIHNAVDALPGAETSPAALPPRGEGDRRGRAAVAGRVWDEAKNLALVAGALGRCRTPWEVEVAGELCQPGRAEATAPPAGPGLRYRGYLDKGRLGALFRRASVCLAPSLYEPFGLAPAEAALAGCAVVASDLPSYREVWGPAACYFRRDSARSLAAVLDRLYDDHEEVARLARAARERITRRYTLPRMVGGYLRLYLDAARRARHVPLPSEGLSRRDEGTVAAVAVAP